MFIVPMIFGLTSDGSTVINAYRQERIMTDGLSQMEKRKIH